MPLLDAILQKNIRLFDYERITNEKGERLVAFGGFAGIAGMITGIRGLGEHFLSQGYQTPFVFLSSSYMYPSLPKAEEALQFCGSEISRLGLPRDIGPCIFTFTGFGNVTKGCLEMFAHLPHEMVSVEDLPLLWKDWDPHKVYGLLSTPKDHVQRIDGSEFEKSDYYNNPENYQPIFHKTIAPYTTVLVNGMYWDYRYPRLLDNPQLVEARRQNPQCMQALFDITCDIGGSVSALTKSTYPELPCFTFDPFTDLTKDVADGDGVLVMGVDMLPAEFPKEASEHFSRQLFPFMGQLVTSDGTVPFSQQIDIPGELSRACITAHGELNRDFKYISILRRRQSEEHGLEKESPSAVLQLVGHLFDSGLINQILDLVEDHKCEFNVLDMQSRVNVGRVQRATRVILQITAKSDEDLETCVRKMESLCDLVVKAESKMTRLPHGAELDLAKSTRQRDILVFGSGFCSAPVLDYFNKEGNNFVTIASGDLEQAKALCSKYPKSSPVFVDATDQDMVDEIVCRADVVISLLPQTLHVPVAHACLRHNKNLVTASYVSDQMRDLHEKAVESQITIVNEIGLDPGLDHMSAMKMFQEIRDNGARLKSFTSVCGGLPAPEAANNPLGYKFSWSPMGVLTAATNTSQWLANGEIVKIPGDKLLRSSRLLDPNPMPKVRLEHIPNRDSLSYIADYNIPEVHTIYRGTVRYGGFCDVMEGFRLCGLLDKEPHANSFLDSEQTWPDYMKSILNGESVEQRLSSGLNKEEAAYALDAFNWLGLFDSSQMKGNANTPISSLCPLLQSKMEYEPGEHDMVVMNHGFGIETASGKEDYITSTLVAYGDSTHTAMARTVGYPVAAAAKTLLEDDSTHGLGVVTACHEKMWRAVLPLVQKEGIHFTERYGQKPPQSGLNGVW